jgi:hypothetical protein
MSTAARRKIAAAQRARWANLRRAKAGSSKSTAKKTMSTVGHGKAVSEVETLLGGKEGGREIVRGGLPAYSKKTAECGRGYEYFSYDTPQLLHTVRHH